MQDVAAISVAMIVLGIICLVLAWFAGFRRMAHGRIKNPVRAIGTVVGASPVNYCGHHTARVRYAVDGKEYLIDGPLFEYGNAGATAKSNLTDRGHLPSHLVAKNLVFSSVESEIQSNDYLYSYSDIARLYPIGSAADVWYDPAEPSRAYVERPIRKGLIPAVMLTGWGTALLAFGVVVGIVL